MRTPCPSLPGPAAVCLSDERRVRTRPPGPAGRHSRLRSAAPLPPAGPPFGRRSCSELASPNALGRRGKMLKRRQKTRERREAATAEEKPAPPRGRPWRRAGTQKPEPSGRTDTDSLSTAGAQRPEAPPPPTRSPAPSPCGYLFNVAKAVPFFRDNQSDVSQFTAPAQSPKHAQKALQQKTTTPRVPYVSLRLPPPFAECALYYGI